MEKDEIQTNVMPAMVRAMELVPSTFNADSRTVDVVWTTGVKVRRYDWWNEHYYDEELVVSPEAVDMTRLNAGASVLNTHMQWDLSNVIGVVEKAWLDGSEGRATIRLSQRDDISSIVRDIEAGIIRHISAGYTVQRYAVVRAADREDGGTVPLYRAERWTPAEISFVPVPADAGSSVRSKPSQDSGEPCEFIHRATAQRKETAMDKNGVQTGGQPQAPVVAATAAVDVNARAAEVSDLCVRHGVPNLIPQLLRENADVDAARAKILDTLARNDAAAGGHRNVVNVQTVQDQFEVRMSGVEQAILHRLTPSIKLDDNGRQYRSMSLLEIGREWLEAQNVSTRGMDKLKLADAMLQHRSAGMHTISDFASLFANVAGKRLRNAYEENTGTYQVWARRAPNAPDFKSMSVVQLSGAPDLLAVPEHGEYTYGTMRDGATDYRVVTYGRIVALTRQAIINDDLRAFDRLTVAFGLAARRLENSLVYAELTASALYSAQNGNNGTGAGSALQLSSLSAMRSAMRLQRGLNGELLNVTPSFLIVPTTLEQTAYQLTSNQYVPAQQSNINEFRTGGRTGLEPVVEPLLDASSATAWYAAANSAAVDTVEYCYLDGAEGPQIESKVGWGVDGVEYKCRLDFAAKAIDHRGLYRANGA
jgi:hypothetical protein